MAAQTITNLIVTNLRVTGALELDTPLFTPQAAPASPSDKPTVKELAGLYEDLREALISAGILTVGECCTEEPSLGAPLTVSHRPEQDEDGEVAEAEPASEAEPAEAPVSPADGAEAPAPAPASEDAGEQAAAPADEAPAVEVGTPTAEAVSAGVVDGA